MRFTKLEEIFQAQELAHALPDASTSHQTVANIINQQQFVDVVCGFQFLSAWSYAGGRVALGVVLHWTHLVRAHFGQIGGELVDSVYCANEHLASLAVDGEVREARVFNPEAPGDFRGFSRSHGKRQVGPGQNRDGKYQQPQGPHDSKSSNVEGGMRRSSSLKRIPGFFFFCCLSGSCLQWKREKQGKKCVCLTMDYAGKAMSYL